MCEEIGPFGSLLILSMGMLVALAAWKLIQDERNK